MRRLSVLVVGILCMAVAVGLSGVGASEAPDWSLNATIIEACTCPMFCQCYFNPEPAAHGSHGDHGEGEHYCKFNMAFKVSDGHHGDVSLDGAHFWIAGDLGSEFADGKTDWAVVTFDKKTTTPAQRQAIGTILATLYPVEWSSLSTAEGVIQWEASTTAARATLDGGKSAELILKHPVGAAHDDAQPVVIKNLAYWGATSNDGFVLMPNEVQAYRVGEKAFESRGTNGFMITFTVDSKQAQQGSAVASK